MKKTIILVLFTMLAGFGLAQTVDTQSLGYSVTYENNHLFLQKDSDFNVVDYEIEWPEIVDFDKATELKRFITRYLTGIATTSLDTLLYQCNNDFGSPVTGQFKTIPDDKRFCYITLTAKIAGYQRGHWIAYYLQNKVEPQSRSSLQALDESRVVVYDISRSRLFVANDLLSSYVIQRVEPQDFYDLLFSQIPDDFYNNMNNCEIDGVWTEGPDLCFLVNAMTEDMKMKYTTKLPLYTYYYTLSRDGKKLFMKTAKSKQPQTLMIPPTWHGDTIYNNVEKMPVFKGGKDGMRQYLSNVSSPGIKLDSPVRVNTSFIVDKEGNVQDVSIISSSNPVLGRHAASIIKGMPRYTPGEQDGKKVCVRLYLPINYR